MHRSYLTFSLLPFKAPLGRWVKLLIIKVNLSRQRCPQVWVAVIDSDNFSIMSITNFLNCSRIDRLASINRVLTHGYGSSYRPQGLQSPFITPLAHVIYIHRQYCSSLVLVKQITNVCKKAGQAVTSTGLSRCLDVCPQVLWEQRMKSLWL